MFEDKTYDVLLNEMLLRIPDNLDKREGSVIFDALAPAALQLSKAYIDLDTVLDETFVDTASLTYLVRRGIERGLAPIPATPAVLKAVFNLKEIAPDSQFRIDDIVYFVTNQIEDYTYEIQATTAGLSGNLTGTLLPLQYIDGLTSAVATEILIHGEDDEPTEDYRKRLIDSFNSLSFGGNIQQYKDEVTNLQDIGGVKVYPVWNGGGTVKIVIVNSSGEVPSPELVDYIQTTLDPTQNNGEGVGLAPIGHVVTVEGVTSTTIDFKFELEYMDGYDWDSVYDVLASAISTYINNSNMDWDNQDNIIIRKAQAEAAALSVTGVLDVKQTLINGDVANVALDENAVAVLGTISEIK